ncbi:MAG: outer membrane protein assembly factor BamB [Gallionellaceae bacterium]|jgi:outer membrane protein assembly factor BamB|nr:outer membrane protein assembly factor BamB [Gallionellaceae bacterium]
MKPARLASLLLIAAALAGCSTISSTVSSTVSTVKGWFGVETVKTQEPSRLTDFSSSARFEVQWRFGAGSAKDAVLTPAITSDAVYAASRSGRVYRIERSSGRSVWGADSGFVISGGVGAGDGLVLVGGSRGEVAAFDESGAQVWTTKVSSEVQGAPRISNGIVVVRSGDGRIVGLNAANGSRQWAYDHTTPALIVRSHAGVVIEGGAVYAGFAGGKLVTLRLGDGATYWEATVSQPRGNTELERISDITSDPVVGNGTACAVSFQGKAACFDIAQGNPLWSREISSDKGMAGSESSIYLTDADGSVSGLDRNRGSSLWKNDSLLYRHVSAPGVIGNYAVVGDYDGYLHALGGDDGGFAARIKLDSAIVAAPQGDGDTLFVQTVGGDVYALSLR